MTFISRFENLAVEDEPVYKSELYDNPSTNLITIETFTASALDPFVTGGFYPALINNTGQTLTFFGSSGILFQSIFQKPVNFS